MVMVALSVCAACHMALGVPCLHEKLDHASSQASKPLACCADAVQTSQKKSAARTGVSQTVAGLGHLNTGIAADCFGKQLVRESTLSPRLISRRGQWRIRSSLGQLLLNRLQSARLDIAVGTAFQEGVKIINIFDDLRGAAKIRHALFQTSLQNRFLELFF